MTRLFRLLRAHGLIQKVSRTSYYRVTRKGTHVLSTALRLRELDLAALAA
jgi:predicted transcriptional regulator